MKRPLWLPHRPLRSLALAVLAVAATTVLSGCPFMTKPTPPAPPVDPYKPRTSPQNLLENLKTAWQQLDAAPYESLLALDFFFYFAEEDHAIGVQYNRDDELESFNGMCDSPNVDKITLSFVASDPIPDENMPDPQNPDHPLYLVTVTNVDLLLVTRDTTYLLENGTQHFWFREENWTDPKAPTQKVWTIVQWRELDRPVP